MLLCALLYDDDAIISKEILPRQHLRSPRPERACKKSKLVTSPFVADFRPSKIAKHQQQPLDKTKPVEN